MTIRHLCLTTLFFFVPYIRISLAADLSIRNITTPTTVDLYRLYNPDFHDDDFDPEPLVSYGWELYDGDKRVSLDSSTIKASVEILAGPSEAAGNDVVDIAAINAGEDVIYSLPASFPLGLYHTRINATAKIISKGGKVTTKNATALGPTINVTASYLIGCGVKSPQPYSNITSPSSSAFTSLYIIEPSAGANIVRDPDNRINDRDEMYIGWDFRDLRNLEGDGITNITIQILDSSTSNPVGPLQLPTKPFELFLKFEEVPMEVGKSYKIQFKYRNDVTDGTVRPGQVLTYTTQEFHLVTEEDYEAKCIEPPALSNSSDANPSSGSPNNPNTGLSLRRLTQPHVLFFCGFLLAVAQIFL